MVAASRDPRPRAVLAQLDGAVEMGERLLVPAKAGSDLATHQPDLALSLSDHRGDAELVIRLLRLAQQGVGATANEPEPGIILFSSPADHFARFAEQR